MRLCILVCQVLLLCKDIGKDLANYMEISLKDLNNSYINFTWNLTNSFSSQKAFNSLTIDTEINYNIKGVGEMFYVTFKLPTAIYDIGSNTLLTEKVSGPALRKLYISQSVGSMGSGLSMASWIIFIIEMGLNPFKSSKSFWVFVNMVQMISYLPLLDCEIPSNLRVILTEYLGMSKASFPFDSLPSWVPNPLTYLEWFKTSPLNERFAASGYNSLSFIYNFSNTIGTWFTIILTYLAFTICASMIPKLTYNLLFDLEYSKK